MKFRKIAKKYQETEHIKIYLLIGLILLVCLFYFATKMWDKIHYNTTPVTFGVSFTPDYASTLGLDPQKTYLQMFEDLRVKKIRLSAYWDNIEPQQNKFNFEQLDFYVRVAEENNAQIILAIGYKLPRWPECRVPIWLKNSSMQYRQAKQLSYIKAVIEHYKETTAITAWQIENEPLLAFGTCDPVDGAFLKREVAFVRSITSKPIIITDSGELSTWVTPMQLSDIFGTTMYRVVESPIIGIIPYPLQPWFYRTKSDLIRKFLAPNNIKTINVELQAEPWAHSFIGEIPIDQQFKYFTVDNFKENVNFAKKVGTSQIYLWGVEWWYWVAKYGHPEFLDFAKTLFN